MSGKSEISLRFLPEIATELALRRYTPLRNGKAPLKYEKLLEWLEENRYLELDHSDSRELVRAAKAVQRAIGSAFASGYVTIEKRALIKKHSRDAALEKRLVEKFPLHDVIVAHIEHRDMESGLAAGASWSNYVHSQLGCALAEYMSSQSDVSLGYEIVGVGSGRGVHSTIIGLGNALRTSTREIHIESLCGSLSQHKVLGADEDVWDADDNAALLVQRFGGKTHLSQIQHPIVCSSDRECRELRTGYSSGLHTLGTPRLGILGVGALNPTHYFYKYAKREAARLRKQGYDRGLSVDDKESIGPHFDFDRALNQLITEAEQVERLVPGYWPVAEIGNYFFFVEPPAGTTFRGKRLEELTRRFQELLVHVNRYLLTLVGERPSKIHKGVIVAGTTAKALALSTLLKRRSEPDGAKVVGLDEIVIATDADTARMVLLSSS